jgi:hypothetical protein
MDSHWMSAVTIRSVPVKPSTPSGKYSLGHETEQRTLGLVETHF